MNKKTKFSLGISILILFFGVSFFYINQSKQDNNSNLKEAAAVENTTTKLRNELALLLTMKKDSNLLLCNKTTLLPSDYKASDIVDSNLPFLSHVTTRQLNSITKTNATEMFQAAKASGINLLGASGYRSNAIQKNLFQSNVNTKGMEKALEYSAPPGASEHETGYALDIVSKESQNLNANFEKSAAFKWLQENAHNYGFVLRYPKDKENVTGYKYEPWHYRYVGKEHALTMKEKALTLEEYLSAIDEQISLLELNLKGD